jgi:hypothetical protein
MPFTAMAIFLEDILGSDSSCSKTSLRRSLSFLELRLLSHLAKPAFILRLIAAQVGFCRDSAGGSFPKPLGKAFAQQIQK